MSISSMAAQQNSPGTERREEPFEWPSEKRAAVSLSFDDARLSQIDTGLALFRKLDVRVTFFVLPANVEKRLAGWKEAIRDGHEIGNHSLTHPCTGNYASFRNNALENYDLEAMAEQLDGANKKIQELLGVTPKTFAYPCGLKFVGRGRDVQSYVPLVAERFLAGRGYLDESPNDPAFCDLPQAMGMAFDDLTFTQMKHIVDGAAKQGRWVIFVGHEIGERGYQITDTKALEELCGYAKDPANGIWLGAVDEIATYIKKQRRTRPQ